MKGLVARSLGIFQTLLLLSVLLGALGCGGADAQGVTFALSSSTNQPAGTVTVSASVSGFDQVLDFQFTLQWDPAVLSYVGLGNYGLNGLTADSFGASAALTSTGVVTCSWDDPTGLGTTVSDGTVVFTISFVVIGGAGSTSSLALVDAPTRREVDSAVTLGPLDFISVNGEVTVGAKGPLISYAGDPSAGLLLLSFPTAKGTGYVLEVNDSLSGTAWTALSVITGDGTVKTVSDSTITSRQRFYRVRVE
jgi:hypothetical protein